MQAVRDPLTGLYNRQFMEESLEREIRRAERRFASLGVIMLDIDNFQQVNATYGDAAGDTVLKELSQFLQSHIRGEDIASRFGGEELVLILPDATLNAARGRADTLRERIKRLDIAHEGQNLKPITVSMGVSCYPEHGSTAAALLSAAAGGVEQAKAEGRDRVAVGRRG